ncbi:serine hydrolase domain-containing protein [Halosegnis marinus]|uniref:Serine hydrolase domain-containing protein n=1 Tax=Halosegnis marinus TaxID=3034023 RepID=A0ABD5ZL09_9EURY|nr:serine hydrolase [Halosegnis sp. DT85]
MDDPFPPRHRTATVRDAGTGIDTEAVREAVATARAGATTPDDVAYDHATEHHWDGDPPEHAGALGPFPDRRGEQNGVVFHRGELVAEWGDTTRVDHCFSVAKSFLSLLAGVASDRGLVDVTDPVGEYVEDGGFEGHNAAVTWEHLLQGTSEWEGTLFGKPDSVDRNRPVGRDADAVGDRGVRDLRDPGTYWEYNDVRINRLALALLRLWGEPLPEVLAREVLGPVGASGAWSWHGYRNSTVEVEGRAMESVSGGGHWGGGLWSSTRNLARVGLLLANDGAWGGRQVVSASWLDRATTPCDVEPGYGYLFWLNTDGERFPGTPESAFAALGYGSNQVWIDPEDDLVVVLRWVESEAANEVYRTLSDAV